MDGWQKGKKVPDWMVSSPPTGLIADHELTVSGQRIAWLGALSRKDITPFGGQRVDAITGQVVQVPGYCKQNPTPADETLLQPQRIEWHEVY